jgi:hypothetical protein
MTETDRQDLSIQMAALTQELKRTNQLLKETLPMALKGSVLPSAPTPPLGSSGQAETEKGTRTPEDLRAVSAAIIELANRKGRAAAVELLKAFDAKSVPDLRSDTYADVLKAAKDALVGV